MVSCCPRLCGLGYPGLSSLGDQVMSQHQTTDEGVNEQISKEANLGLGRRQELGCAAP